MQRPWFAAMLLAALLTRALVPVGFMPDQGGFILCPSYAPVLARSVIADSSHDMAGMAMDGSATTASATPGHAGHAGHSGSSPEHSHSGICRYSGSGAGLALTQALGNPLLAHVTSTKLQFPPEQTLPRGTIVPTRLPRGPPPLA
jgi:hypothetical protein